MDEEARSRELVRVPSTMEGKEASTCASNSFRKREIMTEMCSRREAIMRMMTLMMIVMTAMMTPMIKWPILPQLVNKSLVSRFVEYVVAVATIVESRAWIA